MKDVRKFGRYAAIVLLLNMSVAPCFAADDTTSTGIVAGLGLTAASGKTTISDGGGGIEASILATEAVLKAGVVIRQLALDRVPESIRAKYPKPTIVILGHGDSVDFTMARWIDMRLDDIDRARPPESACANGSVFIPQPQPSAPGRMQMRALSGKFAPAPNDITAALATDVTIQGIDLTTDDRMLVDAVMIGARGQPVRWIPTDDTVAKSTPSPSTAIFKVPGEAIDFSPDTGLLAKFRAHQRLEDRSQKCTSAAYKAWLSAAHAFDESVTASDKGPAPIAAAAELLALGSNEPLVLRVAVEKTGGTAITRSNIFYNLGFPGAATVSAGLVVSFRLSNPVAGEDLITGFVRCAVSPTRFQNVKKVVSGALSPQQAAGLVSCSYIAN